MNLLEVKADVPPFRAPQLRGAFAVMDQINVSSIFRHRAMVMKSVPRFLPKRTEVGHGGGANQSGSFETAERMEGACCRGCSSTEPQVEVRYQGTKLTARFETFRSQRERHCVVAFGPRWVGSPERGSVPSGSPSGKLSRERPHDLRMSPSSG